MLFFDWEVTFANGRKLSGASDTDRGAHGAAQEAAVLYAAASAAVAVKVSQRSTA